MGLKKSSIDQQLAGVLKGQLSTSREKHAHHVNEAGAHGKVLAACEAALSVLSGGAQSGA